MRAGRDQIAGEVVHLRLAALESARQTDQARIALLERELRAMDARMVAMTSTLARVTRTGVIAHHLEDELARIMRAVCATAGITETHIRGRNRAPEYLNPRWAFIALAKQRTPASFADIGRFLGQDHTTVMNANRQAPGRPVVMALVQKVAQQMEIDGAVADG